MFVADGKTIPVGRSFELNGVQYPSNWLRLTSESEKAAVGISWVPDPQPFDSRYYWGRDDSGTLIPKRLEDELAVDPDGEPLLDSNGEQIVNTGLKTQFIAEQKQIAASLLAPTDWYITRQAETEVAAPAAVLAYRAAVRTACGEREAEIAEVTSVEGLKNLVQGAPKIYDEATDALIDNPNPFITPWPENVL